MLLADDGRPLLLDFDLAADAGRAAVENTSGGTLRHMPPEALADLYGLGLILYELLTGTFPYPDPPAGAWRQVVNQMRAGRLAPPPDAAKVRPEVTPATAAILAACLDPDPAKRYPSAAALRDDLQRQLDSRPLLFAAEPSARERVRKWARRHPRLSSAYTAAAAAAVVLLGVVGAFLGRQRHLGRLEAEAARVALDRVLARHPDDPEGLLNRAPARVGSDDLRGAVADLDRLDQLGTPFARSDFVREHAKRLLGDAAGAEQDFRAGLAREPADARGWVARGEARLRLTPPDAAGALADFEAAVKLDPGLLNGWEDAAAVLSEQLGRPGEAVTALGRVLDLNPGHPPARAGRAVLHARADADLWLTQDPGARVLYQAACAYLLTGDRAKALDLLRACLRKDPSWAAGMPADPDLKAVHADPAFRKLVAAAGELAK